MLETGDLNNPMYYYSVNEVDCTKTICNKRISCAGQEWLAGRVGNRSISARNVAQNSKTCFGPYATHTIIQSPYTGYKTCDKIQAL